MEVFKTDYTMEMMKRFLGIALIAITGFVAASCNDHNDDESTLNTGAYVLNNGAWGEIWRGQPGGAIILSTQHNNGNDIATGGPGFSFPVSQWNGTTYVNANRTVADSALGDARFLPN